MDKSKLLDQCGALGEDRTLLARVLDRQAGIRAEYPGGNGLFKPRPAGAGRRSASCGGNSGNSIYPLGRL